MSEEMKNSTEQAAAGQAITEQTTQAGSEPAVQPEAQGAPESESRFPLKKKKLAIIIAAAVVLIALIAGVSIYNTPENRLIRQLETANKYLEEGEYEEAALAFEEAIAIDDRCLEAYAGGIEAYLGAGDVSRAQDFFDRTLTMLSGLDADFAGENRDSVVELYLAADEVYGDDLEKMVQILESGYVVAGENQEIKNRLMESWLSIAKEEMQKSSYEEALAMYGRLLEMDCTNTEILNDLCDCLNGYMASLVENGQYDKVFELAEKYGNVAIDVDFQAAFEKIESLQEVKALMAGEQFDEAEELIERLEEEYAELDFTEERNEIQENKVEMVADVFYADNSKVWGYSMFGIDGIEITRTKEGKFCRDSTLKMLCNYSEDQKWEEEFEVPYYVDSRVNEQRFHNEEMTILPVSFKIPEKRMRTYHSGEMVVIFIPNSYLEGMGYSIEASSMYISGSNHLVYSRGEEIYEGLCVVGEDVYMLSVPIPYGEEEHLIISQELIEFIQEKGSGVLGIGLTKSNHTLMHYGDGPCFYAQYNNVSIDDIDLR